MLDVHSERRCPIRSTEPGCARMPDPARVQKPPGSSATSATAPLAQQIALPSAGFPPIASRYEREEGPGGPFQGHLRWSCPGVLLGFVLDFGPVRPSMRRSSFVVPAPFEPPSPC